MCTLLRGLCCCWGLLTTLFCTPLCAPLFNPLRLHLPLSHSIPSPVPNGNAPNRVPHPHVPETESTASILPTPPWPQSFERKRLIVHHRDASINQPCGQHVTFRARGVVALPQKDINKLGGVCSQHCWHLAGDAYVSPTILYLHSTWLQNKSAWTAVERVLGPTYDARLGVG